MQPLALTDEEMSIVRSLSEPLPWSRRNEFLSAIAEALAVLPVRGPGAAHRIGAEIQRIYFTPGRRGRGPVPKSART